MAIQSKIKWTESTWNPVRGRPRVSEMQKKWVIDIRDRCAETGVLFFFKQWGGKRKSKTGRELDGKTYNEMPG